MKKKKKKGFTLIELVIVIAIIAILVAIAIPRYLKSKNKAKEVAARSNISMLTTAASLRQSEMGQSSDPVSWPNDSDTKEYVEQWPEAYGNDEYSVKITADDIIIYLGEGNVIYDSSNGGIKEENLPGYEGKNQ